MNFQHRKEKATHSSQLYNSYISYCLQSPEMCFSWCTGVGETQLRGDEKCWNQRVGLLLTILFNKTRKSPAPTPNSHLQKQCKTQGLSMTMLYILLNQMLTFQNSAGYWMLMPMECTSLLGCSGERQGLRWHNWNDVERKWCWEEIEKANF